MNLFAQCQPARQKIAETVAAAVEEIGMVFETTTDQLSEAPESVVQMTESRVTESRANAARESVGLENAVAMNELSVGRVLSELLSELLNELRIGAKGMIGAIASRDRSKGDQVATTADLANQQAEMVRPEMVEAVQLPIGSLAIEMIGGRVRHQNPRRPDSVLDCTTKSLCTTTNQSWNTTSLWLWTMRQLRLPKSPKEICVRDDQSDAEGAVVGGVANAHLTAETIGKLLVRNVLVRIATRAMMTAPSDGTPRFLRGRKRSAL
jgi:hypothetical protein